MEHFNLRAKLNGTELEFFVDTGSTHVGLPAADIEALGLSHAYTADVETTAGVHRLPFHHAVIEYDGRQAAVAVYPAPFPILGVLALEAMRLKVDPVAQRLEYAGGPYALVAVH